MRMLRLYLVPTLVINVVIILVPAMLTICLAFCRWDGIGVPVFVGLDNFRDLFADHVFWTALTNNIIWTAIFLTIPIAMGLVAATIMLVARRGSTFFQVIYFLPMVIATAITARVWQGMIYSPITGVMGLANRLGLPLPNRWRKRQPLHASPQSISALVGLLRIFLPRSGRCRRIRSRPPARGAAIWR
jgi:raffinose/stachyose/melibiose transport system permease protein